MKYIEREIFIKDKNEIYRNELELEYQELNKMQKQINKNIVNHFESETLFIRYNLELRLITRLKQQLKEKTIYHSA